MAAGRVAAGAFAKIAELTSGRRVVVLPMEANEAVLASKITGPGQRATLSAVLGEGMKAVTIRVNDVEGVAGFVLPGDHVDVVLTRQSDKDNASNDVIVQNVRVLAVDQQADARSEKAAVAKAVTVEVDETDAQKLSLAAAVGTMSLLLRKAGEIGDTRPLRVTLTDLWRAAQTSSRYVTIEVMRGSKRENYSVPVEGAPALSAGAANGGAGARLTVGGAGQTSFGAWDRSWDNGRSDGEVDVTSQYKSSNKSAGSDRPERAPLISAQAGIRWLVSALAAIIAAALALAPAASQAQQRVAFAGTGHTATVMVTVGKTEDIRTDQSLRRHQRRRSRRRRRQSAHRPRAVDPRQEDRDDARDRLRRRQEAGRNLRRRGVLRHLAAERRNHALHRRRHQGVVDQRPSDVERHRAGRRHPRQGGDDRAAVRVRIRSTP